MARDSTVTQLISDVLRIDPVDAREAWSIEAFARLARELRQPFSRSEDPTHITASAIVTGPGGVLLHQHRKLHRWLQPGGHIDPGETPWDAAMREVHEETGIVATHRDAAPTLVHVDVHEASGHTHLDVRYWMEGQGQTAPQPGESQLVAWFGWDDALATADAGLAGALRRVRSLLDAAERGCARAH